MAYNIISPDGFTISFDNFSSPKETFDYYKQWVSRFEIQGYYSSNKGNIELDDLHNFCQFVKYNENGTIVENTKFIYFWADGKTTIYLDKFENELHLFVDHIPVAKIICSDYNTLIENIETFLFQIYWPETDKLVIQNDNDKLGIIIDVYSKKTEELESTATFWFNDFQNDEYDDEYDN